MGLLTDRKIANSKPTDKHQFIADGGGLYLRVHPSGTKSFVRRSRAGGKATWTALGIYPNMSLADARRACVLFEEEVDVTQEHDAYTVRDAFELWRDLIVNKTHKDPAKLLHRVGKHVLPAIGHIRLAEVTRAQVSSMLTAVAETAPVQANRLLTDCKLLFGYCVERGWLDNSPAALLTRKAVGGKEKPRRRVLEDEEVVALIRELLSDRFAPATRYALAIALLTGQRSGEVRSLERRLVGREWWVIPETKTDVEQKVSLPLPLRRLMRDVFDQLGPTPFKGMEAQVLSRAVARMKFAQRWTPHDLRRTMSTRMNEMGVPPYVVEKCLNHKMTGVMAVYNHAEYLPERKAAWRKWSRYVLGLARQAKKTPGPAGG